MSAHAETTDDKIKNAGTQIDNLEQEKDEKENALDQLNNYKKTLSKDLSDLDNQLADISASLDELQVQVDEKNTSIAEKEIEVEKMQQQCDLQYNNMKKRIRYTYENGQQNVLEMLLDSSSFTDFLNRAEYALAIQKYDRQMLDDYQRNVVTLQAEKETLEDEKTQLVALQDEMTDKQAQVNTLIHEKQNKISVADAEINQTQAEIDDYERQIEDQKAYEKELEKQKAEEDAKRLAEIKAREAEENLKDKIVVPQAGDEALLAALIQCEAEGESYEGKLAVGSVVMNRVASSYFPNTVVGVIYQSGQFSPVASGRFATVLGKGANSTCVQAAKEVLGGVRTLSCLYFRVNTGVIDGIVIGNHVFY